MNLHSIKVSLVLLVAAITCEVIAWAITAHVLDGGNAAAFGYAGFALGFAAWVAD